MEQSKRRQHFINSVLAIQIALILLCIMLVTQPPLSTQTTVYRNGKNGKNSISTFTVREQPINTIVSKPVDVPQPIYVQGEKAPPCIPSETETTVVFDCGEGGIAIIPKPKDGKDGQNGADGFSPPALQIRKNTATGDIEQKNTGDTIWTVLLKKCDYQGTC